MTFLNKFKQSFSYSSIVILIVGIILLVYPAASQQALCRLIGGALIIKGGAGLFGRFIDKSADAFPPDNIWNIVLLGLGVFVVLNPPVVISMIPYAFGLFLFVSSISSLQKALMMKRMGYEKWAGSALFAGIRILLALLMINNPFGTAVALTRFIGACLVYDGRATMVTALGLIKAQVETEKEVDEVRNMNLSRKHDDENIETVEAEFVDVVQETIDVD